MRGLLGTLRRLRDIGNSVIVVEHDEETIRAADHIIDLGPGAGPRGGEIVAQGKLERNSRRAKFAHRRLFVGAAAHSRSQTSNETAIPAKQSRQERRRLADC